MEKIHTILIAYLFAVICCLSMTGCGEAKQEEKNQLATQNVIADASKYTLRELRLIDEARRTDNTEILSLKLLHKLVDNGDHPNMPLFKGWQVYNTTSEMYNCENWDILKSHLNQSQLDSEFNYNMSSDEFDKLLLKRASFCRSVGAIKLAEGFEYSASDEYKKRSEENDRKWRNEQFKKAEEKYRENNRTGTLRFE